MALTRLLPETVLRADDVRVARVRDGCCKKMLPGRSTRSSECSCAGRLPAGQPLRLADLTRPPLVQRGCDGADRTVIVRTFGHRSGRGAGRRCRGRQDPGAEHHPHMRSCSREVVGPGQVRVTPDAPAALRTAPARFDRRVMANEDPALSLLGLAAWLLSGCGTLTRLSEVGRDPAMTPTEDPTKDPKWRPVSMPMPARQPSPNEANSLWRSGSRAFFKDQRAAQVGDIVTVLVNINDTANLKNVTSATRTSAESGGIPNFFGLEAILPKAVNPATLISASSSNNNTGTGQIQRNEAVTLRLAGIVTQVLPNGNLVVAASQEFMVNSELRELRVTGVIRPQDIASDNTVLHDRMAEARIAYGGQGTVDRPAAGAVGSADDGYPDAVLI